MKQLIIIVAKADKRYIPLTVFLKDGYFESTYSRIEHDTIGLSNVVTFVTKEGKATKLGELARNRGYQVFILIWKELQ